MQFDTLARKWYALHTRSRSENIVFENLCKKKLETFFPKIRVRSRRKDRRMMIDVPLFPGYLFVKTDLNPYEHVEILKTFGSVRLVGGISGPVSIPENSIESLKIMIIAGTDIITGNRFKKGDPVTVVSGPFTGVVGYFERYRGKDRVVVQIEALGQFAAVEVDLMDIEPLRPESRFTA